MKKDNHRFGNSMIRTVTALTVLSVLIVFAHTSVVADEAEKDFARALIREALDRSGVERQIAQLDDVILIALPADALPSALSRRELERLVRKELHSTQLLEIVVNIVRKELTKPHLKAVLHFYRSLLGTKVGRLSGRSVSPRALQRVHQARDIVTNLSETRRSILERIIREQQVAAVNTRLLKSVLEGLAVGYAAESGTDRGGPTDAGARLRSFTDSRKVDTAATEEIALTSFAYTLKSLSVEDLERLAQFDQSEPARSFRNAVTDGLIDAAYIAGMAVGVALRSAGEARE